MFAPNSHWEWMFVWSVLRHTNTINGEWKNISDRKPALFPSLVADFRGSSNCTGPQTMDIKKGKSHKFTIHLHCLIAPPIWVPFNDPCRFFWFPPFMHSRNSGGDEQHLHVEEDAVQGCILRTHRMDAQKEGHLQSDFEIVAVKRWLEIHFCGITNGSAFGKFQLF